MGVLLSSYADVVSSFQSPPEKSNADSSTDTSTTVRIVVPGGSWSTALAMWALVQGELRKVNVPRKGWNSAEGSAFRRGLKLGAAWLPAGRWQVTSGWRPGMLMRRWYRSPPPP